MLWGLFFIPCPRPIICYRTSIATSSCRCPEPTSSYRTSTASSSCRCPEPTSSYRTSTASSSCRCPEPLPDARSPVLVPGMGGGIPDHPSPRRCPARKSFICAGIPFLNWLVMPQCPPIVACPEVNVLLFILAKGEREERERYIGGTHCK